VQPAASGLVAASIAKLPVNGGALASALVLIVIALVVSIGIFEQQEL
jgi:uncharacterized membrane protein